MQIDSALSSTLPGPDRATTKSRSVVDDTATQTVASEPQEQDDAVHISAEGAATAAQEGNTVQDGTVSDSAGEDASATDVSAAKSFAYGTLGLERPDEPHEAHNAFYTAGRWLAAGITIGGIISLLV
ncbi:hypothetical protein [Paraburkholderia caffeinilytica]|uniref:Uncharacterized protein n=1 Tax=Paraburkholderia caffeinilytica TaxID=1761016 RepID=A0ABQ1MLQ6_9BURK|nr:hypothetical protein [Paraburkholderia caffeinilytica]GGC42760.1 hypothetical protein GCM10011400_32100 [Paraburkholderia caffeinilytica]CAB3790784.1 hypothetical protein LMG28690_03175 [Paraburkholderia caffeinilytica]